MPFVIGTAGHIDHGKTSLIKALTGQDTDRLKEEKERGISIDLGFAYFDLPDGTRAGIVDVPGHERFIRNMLAGAHGIDLVLFTVAADDVSLIDETQQAVSALLEQRHGGVDFQIRNMASLLETATETQDTLTVLLGSIAAISLLVGGIGVMNIMLVNVTERTREIGVRMATGARMRDILQQFLSEALAVSALGGVIGVAAGLGTAALVGALGTPVKFAVFPVLLAFGCAFATGLIFGYMPARKAAALDPVVALSSD